MRRKDKVQEREGMRRVRMSLERRDMHLLHGVLARAMEASLGDGRPGHGLRKLEEICADRGMRERIVRLMGRLWRGCQA